MSKQSLIRSVRHYKTGALQRLHVGGVLVIYNTAPICPTTFFSDNDTEAAQRIVETGLNHCNIAYVEFLQHIFLFIFSIANKNC